MTEEEKRNEEEEKRREEEKMAEKVKNIIEVQLKALNGIVSVNSLFTIAIFVGLSLASPNQHSLEGRHECDADPGTAQRLVHFEVVSFALFLLSSLAATTCKIVLNTRKHIYKQFQLFKHNRATLLCVSAISWFAAIVLLTLSMVNVVEIEIGKLSCGSSYAIYSVGFLCVVVVFALVIYGSHMIFAVSHSFNRERELNEGTLTVYLHKLNDAIKKMVDEFSRQNTKEDPKKKSQQEKPKKTTQYIYVLY